MYQRKLVEKINNHGLRSVQLRSNRRTRDVLASNEVESRSGGSGKSNSDESETHYEGS